MEITAAMVNEFRKKTGLPMMDCKKALSEAAGDFEKAEEIVRKMGLMKGAKMADREASEGRIAVAIDGARGGICELRCESAPVANTDDFTRLAELIASHAAKTDAPTAEGILAAPLVGKAGQTVQDAWGEAFNRMRENMKIQRVASMSGQLASYVHHNGKVGVLAELSGAAPDETRRGICMHIASMKPRCTRRDEVPAPEIAAQKAAFLEEAKGKPPQIAEKMVEGKLSRWFSEFVLLEQAYVLDDKKSVGEALKGVAPGLTVTRFRRFEVGVLD